MQDFDTLRDRVDSITQKLTSAHAERENRTESLVAILRQLEEKHAAQAQQLVYYRDRLEPLQGANQQLTGLMENLLDLIDRGFGEESLEPLQAASSMASAMLESDLFIAREEVSEAVEPEPVAEEPVAEESIADEPIAEELADANDAPDDQMESLDIAAADEVEPEPESGEEPEDASAVSDLEMEEDALISLDELLDLASEEPADEMVAFDEADAEETPVAADAEEITMDAAPDDAIADDPVVAESLEMEEPQDEAVAETDMAGEEDAEEEAILFEEVSDAVLELEVEEDTAAGVDDLPEIVKQSMAASDSEEVDLVPDIPSFENEAELEADAETADSTDTADDDLETIAALAQAIEEETASEGAAVPAQSDIRALLLRVEALAKKAESMRIAQGGTEKPKDVASAKEDTPPEEQQRQAGAAA